ncbi:MAG: metallophosphatase family protein [Actinomycetota bacterium]|nr:metallophosphatase family protein [Actinomycetota bacterium]
MSPKRIAALYDVHGNEPALEAVLQDVDSAEVDLVVVGGDVVWGPLQNNTTHRLRSLETETIFIRGNCEREVGERLDESAGLDEITAAINTWCADRLTVDERSWLLNLPEAAVVSDTALGAVLFCHGSPRSDEESLTTSTPFERLRAAVGGVRQDVVVCGHTHMQFDLMCEGRRVVNAGSVGLPYEGRPGAYWALIDEDVRLRRTEYDLEAAVAALRSSGCPHVEEVFVEALVTPPSPREIARQFEALASRSGF